MGLLSTFKRRNQASSNSNRTSAANAEPAGEAQTARTRARQRLIGAAVLVGAGVIGFPLVFETRPRPVAVDIPIIVPRKENAAPLVMPPARSGSRAAAVATTPAPTPTTARKPEPAPTAAIPAYADVITETRADAGRELPPPSPPLAMTTRRAASTEATTAPAAAKPRVAANVAASATPTATAAVQTPASKGKPVETGRFVVQIGAYAEPSAAREVRQKMDKVGLKTYTQVTRTDAGERVRVRIGPYSTRDEAEKALTKARNAGLTAVVLSL
jgi:DedD protein